MGKPVKNQVVLVLYAPLKAGRRQRATTGRGHGRMNFIRR